MEINKINNINREIQISSNKPTIEKSINLTREFQKQSNHHQQKKDKKEIEAVIESANRMLFKNNTSLRFEAHDDLNFLMVKIIDDKTGETVKEIPSEKMVEMISKMQEVLGVFVDKKA